MKINWEKRAKPTQSGLIRTPTVLQMEAVECGAASLAMVLAYYGRFIPLEQLRTECGVSRDGSNAGQLAKAARRHGLEAQGKRRSLESLRSDGTRPSILFWGFGHFVVFEGMRGSRYQVNDPAMGRRWIDEDEFSRSFTGITVEFSPGPDFEPSGHPPSLFRGFRVWLTGNRVAAVYAVLCGILLSVPGAIIPGLTSAFLNGVVQSLHVTWAAWIIVGMVLMLLLQISLVSLQAICINRLQFRMFMIQATRMGEHMLRLPMRFFTQRSPGDLVARFTSNQAIAQNLAGGLLTGLVNLVTAIVYGVTLVIFNPLIGCIAIASAFLLLVAIRVTNVRLVDRNTSLQQDVGRQYGALMSLLREMPEIKATSRQGESFGQWAGYQSKGVNAQQSVARITNWLDAAPTFVSGLVVSVIVLTFGGWEVMQGKMTIGGLVAMQMLAGLLITPVSQLVMLARTLQTTQAQMARVLDVMQYELDPDVAIETDRSGPPAGEKLGGRVAVEDVTFGFDRTAEPLLRDLSFTLEPGVMVALVGPSGCGKSTIADLLLGLEKPWTGQICFDGMPRGQVPQPILVESVTGASGVVTAFDATLRDNVTLWDSTVSDEDVIAALHDASCAELLERPGGLDTRITEGGRNLSGGQLQRLEIARTLGRNPSVLVLDGATSALDGETEAQVLERVHARGCTTLLVTERSSALQFVDEVLITTDGKISDRGRPDELATRNEWFRAEFGDPT